MRAIISNERVGTASERKRKLDKQMREGSRTKYVAVGNMRNSRVRTNEI